MQDRRLPHGGRIGIRADITELVERERSFRVLFDGNPMPMLLVDGKTLQIVTVNDAAVRFYGYSRPAFLGLSLADIQPEQVDCEVAQTVDWLHEPDAAAASRVHRTASGEERTVRVSGRMIEYEDRSTLLATVFDITDQLRMEAEVRRSREFLRTVLDQIPTAVFVKDMWDKGRYILSNKASEALYGHPCAKVLGATARDFAQGPAVERIEKSDQAALQLGSIGTVDDVMLKRPDGTERLIRTRKVGFSDEAGGAPRYVLGIAEDVTEQRATEAKIAFMAHHDALTELPNRYLFRDRLESALARLPGTSELLAVLLVDLDGFKAVNDSWGHGMGDALLRSVAGRLLSCLRPSDTAARLGGDEFAVLLAPLDQIGEAAWVATRLISQLSAGYNIDGRPLRTSASIGVSLAPLGGLEPSGLLSLADAALYQAKREGRNRFRFADPSLNTHVTERRTGEVA
ncbi:MAG: diguanylate cyclase [Methylobacteriaceae bacterium]|nr:diguanylate cyclase [Methylobacteriaceae bacterium]